MESGKNKAFKRIANQPKMLPMYTSDILMPKGAPADDFVIARFEDGLMFKCHKMTCGEFFPEKFTTASVGSGSVRLPKTGRGRKRAPAESLWQGVDAEPRADGPWVEGRLQSLGVHRDREVVAPEIGQADQGARVGLKCPVETDDASITHRIA